VTFVFAGDKLMQKLIAALTIILLLGMVLVRSFLMNRQGIQAIHFGKLDRKDFLIPPFALFYFYTVFANAFSLPTLALQSFFYSEVIAWLGVLCCLAGLLLVLWSLISFGRSFRVGIDTENPDKLITTGVFAYSRNPIYLAFWLVLLGQFLIFPNWILLIYWLAATWLFHRQVLREEAYLKEHYGSDYTDYMSRVRRYI
jgi:protein-S-isoprenylcysteine O-methyltransferase Ste14